MSSCSKSSSTVVACITTVNETFTCGLLNLVLPLMDINLLARNLFWYTLKKHFWVWPKRLQLMLVSCGQVIYKYWYCSWLFALVYFTADCIFKHKVLYALNTNWSFSCHLMNCLLQWYDLYSWLGVKYQMSCWCCVVSGGRWGGGRGEMYKTEVFTYMWHICQDRQPADSDSWCWTSSPPWQLGSVQSPDP